MSVSGCATKTEYVWVKSDCKVPKLVTEEDLPQINVDTVYNALEAYLGEKEGRAAAEALLKRERLIVDNLFEHRAIIKQVCAPDEN